MEMTCRCCLSSEAVEYIFNKVEDKHHSNVTFSEMIAACTSFSANATDGLPDKICNKCSVELKAAYSFRLKCDKTYNTLKSITNLTIDLGECKDFADENFVSIGASQAVDDFILEDGYKEEKGIKIEYEEDVLDLPIEELDCDGDEDYIPDETDDGIVKDDIKIETEGTAPVRMRRDKSLKRLKLKKEMKLKIKICPECGATFKRKLLLKAHLQADHPDYVEEKYFCKICQKYYKNGPRHLYSHKILNKPKKFECGTCNRSFHNIGHLNNHMEIHSEERKYSCEECGAAFKQSAALYKHRSQHKQDKYYCEFCSKTFKMKYNLTVHLRTHTNEKPFTCPVCHEGFSTGNSRNIHLDKHTDLGDLDKDSLAAFLKLKLSSCVGKKTVSNLMCPHCGKLFRRSVDLKEHVNRHLGIKEYFCQICQKHFLSERKHKQVHSKNRERRCEICLKTFASQQSLKTHISIHNDARPFVCDCGASFKQNAALYRHKGLHEAKSFICQYCSKLFSTKYKLEIHMRIHTKERPYACDMCPLKFYTGNILKTHKLRHSDFKGLLCDLCEKTFKTKSDLRQHLKVHQKVRKYPCKICNKNFFRSDHRNRHETTVHSMEVVKPENEDSVLN